MSDTPETKKALDYIYDRDGELWERNAPEKLVTLCRKLERERDDARKECEDLKTRLALMDDFKSQILQGYATAIGCAGHESPVRKAELLVKERDELRAEVEQLQADKARLDWLDSFNNTVTIQCEDGGIWIEIEDYKKVNDEPEKSLRDAIDAAMKVAE